MGLRVGDAAPDFTLPGVEGDQVGSWTLSALRGQPVVLVFYPGDGTPVCTRQLVTYTDEIEAFADVGALVLALSPQSVESHQAFARAHGGFAFPLLADEEKAVGHAFGTVGPLGFYRRSVFVVDAGGTVGWIHRAVAGLTFQPPDDIAAAVARST
ncbi:peroxiredoxin [Iamia majanohamensis]|uniref:thioredoxin-dependent peroxiredoxin n=1 Tax=Iamia majanohamensis TaxID=467976 RepID=A0AAF0BVL4_9ACTN|nr:peroxiredoxin [Iamia majanohamensis]WCO68977.1 peroxiredoxin [Iamia majanohamensis]